MYLIVPKKRKDYSYLVSTIDDNIKHQMKEAEIRVFNLNKPIKEVMLNSSFEVITK